MIQQAAVFVDGGYLSKVLRHHFGEPRIDYAKLASWSATGMTVFRTYYYDCLPHQSSHPTQEERERLSRAQRFFTALERLERFTVRQGRLAYRGIDDKGSPVYQQKRVDLQLGLDIASVVSRGRVQMIVLVSGDSDLIPAVQFAQQEAVLVRLVHGPKHTYHQDLWDIADERYEITQDVIDRCLMD